MSWLRGGRERSKALTPRQLQVVRLRALGYTNAMAGHELGISTTTATKHMESAFVKTDTACLVDLLRAVGWLKVPDQTTAGTVHVAAYPRSASRLSVV